MSIELQRDSIKENTFIVTLYSGWNWDHVSKIDEQIRAQKNESTKTHILVEIEGPMAMPERIEDLAPTWLDAHVSQHGGLLIFVTEWAMVASMFRMLFPSKTGPMKLVRFAKTCDEARQIVTEWETL